MGSHGDKHISYINLKMDISSYQSYVVIIGLQIHLWYKKPTEYGNIPSGYSMKVYTIFITYIIM